MWLGSLINVLRCCLVRSWGQTDKFEPASKKALLFKLRSQAGTTTEQHAFIMCFKYYSNVWVAKAEATCETVSICLPLEVKPLADVFKHFH